MSAAKRSLGYQPAFDGLRAVSIGLVVLVHVFGWPGGGYLGVDLFFVLSGFLITTLLVEEHDRYGSISLRGFFARRALRLVPALTVYLAVLLATTTLLGSHLRDRLTAVLFGFTYTTNLAVVVHGPRGVFEHLWSLAVEDQFYLLWPLLLLLALGARVRLRSLALGVLAVAVTIAAVRLSLTPARLPSQFGTATVTRFDSILVGCAVALLYASPLRTRLLAGAKSPWALGISVAGMAGLAVAGGHTKAIYHGFTFLFALAAAVVLLAVLVSDDDPAWLVRLRRPLTSVVSLGLGRVSYALYLWHPTVVSWIDRSHLAARIGTPASRLAAIGLAVACASASYHGVERPFLRRKRKLARVGGSSAEPVPTAARAVLAPAASEA